MRLAFPLSNSVAHRGETATFTFSISPVNQSPPVTVRYVMGGKGRLGRQYALSGTPGQVTIPAGASSATVTLTVRKAGRKGKTVTLLRGWRRRLQCVIAYELLPSRMITYNPLLQLFQSTTLMKKTNYLLLVASLVIAGISARATTVIPPTFEQLVDQAELIFQGKVTQDKFPMGG